MKNPLKHCYVAGFTLIEMTLTLFLLSGLFIIGSQYSRPKTDAFNEKLAMKQFKRAWDSAVSYSVTHRMGVSVNFTPSARTVTFRSHPDPNDKVIWVRTIQFPDSIKFGSNATALNYIYDGKTQYPITIVFSNKRDDYEFTAQLFWGRLIEKKKI